jgi:ferric-dicitrate binding protein FerR (iron transport regulator)
LLSFWSQFEKRSELMARSLRRSLISPSRAAARRSGTRRLGAGLAGVALAATLAGCATPYVSDSGGTAPGAGSEQIVLCDSGVVTHPDGTETSSSIAVRIPAGAPIPAGCRLG